MHLRDVEYFKVVAEHGHVGRAAEALGIGQPALSMSLRRLEKVVQAQLVNRTPKGVELTATGSLLLARVRRLQLARDDIAREIADLQSGRAGHLRIGVSPGLPEELAGVAGGLLMREAPGVILRVTVLTSERLLGALRGGELDLGVCIMPPHVAEELVHEPLLEDEFVVFTFRDHRLARRKRVTLGDLASESWAKSAASRFPWEALHNAFAQRGLKPPHIAVESDSTSLRLHAVASSNLLGLISRPFLARATPRLRLTELRADEETWPRRIAVSYRDESYISPAARRLTKLLMSTAREFA